MFSFLFISCSSYKKKVTPSRVYMPDMYYSDAYEPYSDPNFEYNKKNKKIEIPIFSKEKTSALIPVPHTISRENEYEKISYFISEKGLNYSKKINHSPIINSKNNQKIINEGKLLYKINCSICHGDKGNGQGILVKNEKIFGIPDYKDRDLTVGSVYYVITYGKNNMNSYASQLNKIDRWKTSEYVMYLKNK